MSLFGAISVSASGMEAQRTRAEVITENLANADTTRTPEGGPYQTQRRRLHHHAARQFVLRGSLLRHPARAWSVRFRHHRRRPRPRAALHARSPRCRRRGLRGLSAHRSGRRNGRSDERLARLPGECGRHIRGQGYDRAFHRSIQVDGHYEYSSSAQHPVRRLRPAGATAESATARAVSPTYSAAR